MPPLKTFCVGAAGAALLLFPSAFAQSLSVQTEVSASDGSGLDQFGWSVAMNGAGTRAVIGAVGDDDGGSGSGSAYIFVKSGSSWVFEDKLVALDAGANDFFGQAVAMDLAGDRVVVGAIFEDSAGFNAGAAYVFSRSGSSWSQEDKLSASDALTSDSFGKAVAIDWAGSRIVIGVEDKDVNGQSSGAAYVYERMGTSWLEEQQIVPADNQSGDGFGTSVAIDSSGSRVAISAANDDDLAFNAGSVYVFSRSGSSWGEEGKILPPEAQSGDFIGESVSISALGDRLAIGAQGADDNGQNSGVAYVYERSGSQWSQAARLVAGDGAADDFFGGDIAIDGAGDTMIVGARGHDSAGADVGAAYVYARTNAGWLFSGKRTPAVFTAGDAFGNSVCLNSTGDIGVVGASGSDASAVDSGSAWMLESDDLDVPGGFATIQDAVSNSLPGDTVVVAPGTYIENVDFEGREITLVASGGASLTTIQGVGGSVVRLTNGEGPGAILDGFTITGGDGGGGAGVRIAGADPIVRNCVITGNSNLSRGGGLEVDQAGAGHIEDCLFTQNSSGLGGALSIAPGSSPHVLRCRFEGNQALTGGGAVLCGTNSDGTFENCTFLANSSLSYGGAIYLSGLANARFVSCLMAHNTANEGGAIYALVSSTPELVNLTVTENVAASSGGGLASVNSSASTTNSVWWNNSDASGTAVDSQITQIAGSGVTVSSSLVAGGFPTGSAILDFDPVFVSEPADDFRLTFGSPGIDAGDNTLVPAGFDFDLNGRPRFLDDPTTPDTGNGTAPLVDLGAFEWPDACGPEGLSVSYCTSKTNSLGCQPQIAWSGRASQTDPGPFTISATMELNFKNGILFYGFNGRTEVPFQGGILCVVPPLRRTPFQNSGGTFPPTNDCSGTFSFDFNAWFQAGSDPIVAVGQVLRAQYWSRDPAITDGSGAALSNAVEFYVCP